jgi:hypothetical protein
LQLRVNRRAADRLDGRHVGIIDRREDDHLVARPDEGGDGGEDRLRRPGGHRHLALDVEARAVQRRHLVDDGLAQLRHAGHRRILVAPGQHVAVHGVEQRRLGLEVGKALRQVDRPALGSQPRHDGKNGRPHGREAGIDADRGLHGPVAVDGQEWPKIIADTAATRKDEAVSFPTWLDAPDPTAAGSCDKPAPSVQRTLLESATNRATQADGEVATARGSGNSEMPLAITRRTTR